jgi:hypothetical protein
MRPEHTLFGTPATALTVLQADVARASVTTTNTRQKEAMRGGHCDPHATRAQP